MTDDNRRDQLNDLRRRMSERRATLFLPPYGEVAERYLSEWYPGLSKVRADETIRQLYDSVRRRHEDEIDADVDEFADVFLLDNQRTPESIEAWSKDRALKKFSDDDYDRQYYEAALRVAITVYIERHRAYRSRYACEPGWWRIVERFVDVGIEHSGFQLWTAREKWGVLHLSWEALGTPDDLREAEVEAREASTRTCEICGRPGKLRKFHWRKTLCDEHAVGRELSLTDEDYERLQRHFANGQDRWRPLITGWQDEGLSADTIYQDFLQSFADLDPDQQKFWSVSCTRLVLTRRRKAEGRPFHDGI